MIVHRSSTTIAPVMLHHTVDIYSLEAEDTVGPLEKDGEIAAYPVELGPTFHVHSRLTERGRSLTVVVEIGMGNDAEIRKAIQALRSIPWLLFSITDVLTVAELSMVQNLSPAPGTQLTATYLTMSFKPDGERCYGIIQCRLLPLSEREAVPN